MDKSRIAQRTVEMRAFNDERRAEVELAVLEREADMWVNLLREGTITPGDPILSAGDIAKETGWSSNVLGMGTISQASDRQRGAYFPFFRTDQELAAARMIGRRIATTDGLGKTIVRNLVDYLICDGVNYLVEPIDKEVEKIDPDMPGQSDPDVDDALKTIQKFVDLFVERNGLKTGRAREIVRESLEAGESLVILRKGTADDNVPDVICRSTDHLVWPANGDQLEEWKGLPEGLDWSFGIATTMDRYDKPLAYAVEWYGIKDNNEVLTPEEVVHIKLNVPEDVKRGLNEFFVDYMDFARVARGMNYASDGATVQASIALVEKLKEGIPQQAATDATSTPATYAKSIRGTNGGVYPIRMEGIASARMVRTDHDIELGAMGDPKGFQLIQVFKAVAQRILAVRRMPEWMGGDASNNNLSSSVTAGSAFDVAMQGEQTLWADYFEKIIWKALAFIGVDVVAAKKAVKITAKLRQIASRDAVQDEEIRKIRFDAGVLSAKTWAQEVNLDYDEEVLNGAKVQAPAAVGGFGGSSGGGSGGMAGGGGGDRPPNPDSPTTLGGAGKVKEGRKRGRKVKRARNARRAWEQRQLWLGMTLKQKLREYDDSEARDGNGQWTDGDGSDHLPNVGKDDPMRKYIDQFQAMGAYGTKPAAAVSDSQVDLTPPTWRSDEVGAAQAWGNSSFGDWKEGLNDGEKEAIDHYQGLAFAAVNTSLRTGAPLADYFKPITENLDSAIAKGSVPNTVVVMRGLSEPLKGIKAGDVITDKGYISTSLTPKHAEEFESAVGAELHIKVPKGSHGAYLDVVHNLDEQELVLPRDTKLKINGVGYKDGKQYINAEVAA